MMGALAAGSLASFAAMWFTAMARACWHGGTGFVAVWAVCSLFPRLSPTVRCWLWRLAYARLIFALFWITPVHLPVLAVAAPAAPGMLPPSPSSFPGTLTTPLFWLWVAGAAFCTVRLVTEWVTTNGLRKRGERLGDGWLRGRLSELCAAPGRPEGPPPELIRTPEEIGPALIGSARPAILLSDAVLKSFKPAELRLVLAHEVAHLKRGDLRWDWLPAIAHAIFYFH